MPAPFYVGDEVPLSFEAQDANGQGPTSVTVDIYDQTNTLVIDNDTATVTGTTVTYNISESVIDSAGNYRAVFSVVFPGTITRSFTVHVFVRDPTSRYSTYGTVSGVEGLVGDVVSSRSFTTVTVPSFQQVQGILDGVASELNIELLQQGYTVPVRGVDDPIPYQYLVYVNNAGASARVLSTMPMESYLFPDEGRSGGDRREMLDRELWHAIQRIKRQEFRATRTTGLAADFIAGSRTDRSTGDVKNPLFTRDLTDFPGSRLLQE